MGLAQVFIGYSPNDLSFFQQLNTHLAPLERLGSIKVHHEGCINPGSEWRRNIEQFLSSADLIILLISADFIASEFCYVVELEQALMRHHAGLTHLLPVIVRDCAWQQLPIGTLRALPDRCTSVLSHPNPDQVWATLCNTLRQLLDKVGERPESRTPSTHSVPPGGGYDRALYVSNPKYERDVINHINNPGTPAVLRAPMSYGKTWIIQNVSSTLARDAHTHLCSLNLRLLGPFYSAEEFFSILSDELVKAVGFPVQRISLEGRELLSPTRRFSKLLEVVLREHIPPEDRIVMVFDHADSTVNPAVPQSTVPNDLFGLLRNITERAQSDMTSLYRRLRLIVAISYSPAFLLNGIRQSLFDFVADLNVPSFNKVQLADLADKYGVQTSDEELDEMQSFVGGHPYLSSRTFYYAALENRPLRKIIDDWQHGNFAIFDEHLRRIRSYLERLGVYSALQKFKQRQRVDGLAPRLVEVLQRLGVLKFNHDDKSGYDFQSKVYRALV